MVYVTNRSTIGLEVEWEYLWHIITAICTCATLSINKERVLVEICTFQCILVGATIHLLGIAIREVLWGGKILLLIYLC